jgi:hypothetical protein
VSERAINNWYKRHGTVGFDIADDVLAAGGWNWFDVWRGDEVCSDGRTVEEVFTSEELTMLPVAA